MSSSSSYTRSLNAFFSGSSISHSDYFQEHVVYALLSEIVYYSDANVQYSVEERNRKDLLLSRLPKDWQFLTDTNSILEATARQIIAENGYCAIAFIKRGQRSQIIVAHRGTVPKQKGNIKANWCIMNKECPNEILTATSLFISHCIVKLQGDQYPYDTSYSFSHTGHSLGGFIAQVVTGKRFANVNSIFSTNIAVTFDNPGAKYVFMANDDLDIPPMIAYLTNPNAVNITNEHIGLIRRLSIGAEIPYQSGSSIVIPTLDATICHELFMTSQGHEISGIVDSFLNRSVSITDILEWPVATYNLEYGERSRRFSVVSQNQNYYSYPSNFPQWNITWNNTLFEMITRFVVFIIQVIMFTIMRVPFALNATATDVLWEITFNRQTRQGVIAIHREISNVQYLQYQEQSIQSQLLPPQMLNEVAQINAGEERSHLSSSSQLTTSEVQPTVSHYASGSSPAMFNAGAPSSNKTNASSPQSRSSSASSHVSNI